MAIYIFPISHTAPEIISLARAKDHLRVDPDDTSEDNLISLYIKASIQSCENYTGININEAKWEVKSDDFIDEYEFKVTPVQSIDSVIYFDADGAEQTLSADLYDLYPIDRYKSKIMYDSSVYDIDVESDNRIAVTIAITSGFASGKVPEVIQDAILLILTDMYDNRTDKVHNLPTRSQSLLRAYKLWA